MQLSVLVVLVVTTLSVVLVVQHITRLYLQPVVLVAELVLQLE
jgi:hypothetical protein